MKHYVVYDDKGNIIRSGTCQNHMLESQASRPGEQVVEGRGEDALHVVVGGEIVPIEQARLVRGRWKKEG